MKVEIFNADDSSTNSIKEDVEKRDREALNWPTAQSYLYAIVIIHIHWRENDVTDYLELLVLSHLHHFLCIADNASIMTA